MGVFECTLDRVIEELKNYNDFNIHRLLLRYGITGGKGTRSDEHVMLSAKCQALAELLPSLESNGHQVMIFIQWTSVLDFLEWTSDVIGVLHIDSSMEALRLVTKGTIDENVYEIAKRKLTLDAAVLESGIDVADEGDTSEKTMGQILSSLLMS